MRVMQTVRRSAPIAALALVSGLALVGSGPASAARTWAPAATAAVHPGIQTLTEGSQCTANFVFTDAAGTVYLGQAAHCAGTGGNTETNGCSASTLPEGTAVDVGTGHNGTIVYSSWVRMQAGHETDTDTCAYNDLALIKLDPADVSSTNPSVPFFGGPVALSSAGLQTGDTVLSYGNSSLRFGLQDTSPKQGVSLGDITSGWSHDVFTVTPGIPGDSGSGFLDGNGNAFGVLSTVAILLVPGSNGVGDLSHELTWAASHGGPAGLALAVGTEPFTGPIV